MANLPLITVVADVIDNLINGHYRHQQEMAELENQYRLEKARIEQETVISCKKIDATLNYALAHLAAQMEQSRQNFALLVKNLDLQLEDNKKNEQRMTNLTEIYNNPEEVLEIRLMALKVYDAMIKTQNKNAKKRHALLVQQLQQTAMLPPPSPNLPLK